MSEKSMMRDNADQRGGFIDLCEECNQLLPTAHHYTEIGAWMGESATIAAKYFKKITSIDPYPREDMISLRENYLENTKHIQDCTLLELPSSAAVELFDDLSIDILYIDGCHEYESVKADFISYHDKVKPGGVISGHDYWDDVNDWPGVRNAVDEMLEKYSYKLHKRFSDSSWMVIKGSE